MAKQLAQAHTAGEGGRAGIQILLCSLSALPALASRTPDGPSYLYGVVSETLLA